MKQTVTVNSVADLKRFKREFGQLVDIVRQADGKYVLYVDTRRDSSPATRSMFITKAQFDSALSPAMRTGPPAAFSSRIAGGRFLPHRLTAAYGAYQRAQARADIENNRPGSALIRNREQFLAVYADEFGFYPPGRMGDFLNAATKDYLKI